MKQKKPINNKPVKASHHSRHRRPEKLFSFQEADDRIYDVFRHHQFSDYPHERRQKLTQFYRLLMEHQMSDNVTRLVKLRDVAIKHFIDSLMIPRLTQIKFPLLDVGTGPGFPGIPLRIHFDEGKIILAEGVRRRVNFLKEVRQELNLIDLDIVGRYVTKDFSYPVQGVITRALEDISQTLENISQCLEVGGQLYLMKGPNVDEELRRAKKKWGDFYQLSEDHSYELPNTPHQRRLLVFTKIKTPGSVEP